MKILTPLFLITLMACVACQLDAAQLNVPTEHPRLWFTTPQELASAQQWYQNNPTNPDSDDFLGLAFRGLMTSNSGDCQTAAQHAVDIEIDVSQISSDSARWYGETALLIYDWCYPHFTATQRNLFTQNWNAWQAELNQKPWGNARMEANNYFWGYLRNGAEWGITSLGDNPQAQSFIDHALDFRYQQRFNEQWATYFGRGGVPGEGTQYGRYMLDYGVVPLITAQNYGFNTYQASPFYRENLFYLIYATLPKPMMAPPNTGCFDEYWYLFPFNDDEQFFVCFPETAKRGAYGNVLSSYIRQWPQTELAQYAQHWLDRVEPATAPWIRALTPAVMPKSFADLPLDYFAPGSGFAYLRNSWADEATVINLQLGVSGNVGHNHLDAGSFQIWQNGQWLTRETTSYTEHILSWGGGPATEDALNAVGHNTVLFQGQGQKFWSPIREDQFILPDPPNPEHDEGADGLPKVTRIQRHNDFFFAATNLSAIYRARLNRDPCRYDWPFAESVVRDFLYLRGLNVLVVFDRMESSGDSIDYANGSACNWTPYDPASPVLNADQVSKTFLMHFSQQPQINNNQVSSSLANEKLIMTTLLPQNPSYEVFHEGSAVGQYRLELNTSGSAASYFLHVIQLGDAQMNALPLSLTETATAFELTLDGNHQVSLNKGMQSTGGTLTINQVVHELSDCVQNIRVDDSGPHWGEPGCVIFKDGFEGIE